MVRSVSGLCLHIALFIASQPMTILSHLSNSMIRALSLVEVMGE